MAFQACKRYLASLVLLVASASAQQPVAQTPPMGWNSWDAYGLTITEPQFRDNVAVLKSKLLPYGWNYAVIDEGWFFENPEDRETPDKLHYAIDPYGRYVPVPARFPSAGNPKPSPDKYPNAKLPSTIEETSFTALGNYVHAQGLKFGIHIVRGIPRASVERNLPVQGSSFHATDVADTSDACPWDPTNWGVKDNAAGQTWYDSLLRQYASWGVDLLKVDCIGDHPYQVSEIRMIRRAIDKTGRPIVLSISPGPMNLSHAEEIGTLANMWRISDDEWDVWAAGPKGWPQGILDQIPRLSAWEKYAKPGTWPDADMLALGELGPHPGWGTARHTNLTADEQKTLLTAWAMSHSPLILGANLTQIDAGTLRLLTNRDFIAIDQISTKNDLSATGSSFVWTAELPGGQAVLAFFNLSDKTVSSGYSDGYFTPASGSPGRLVREVWTHTELGRQTSLSVTVPPHVCALYILH